MTNLTRKNQKVFASGASNNGQFGSLQAETKVLSNDIETLQALAAYEAGWNSAVVSGEQLPSLEEFQALNYINTYQIGYILQKGFPEWNTDTTYYIGDLAREVGGTKIYKSITNSNSGNALTDVVEWQLLGDLADLINSAQATTSSLGSSYLPQQITVANNATDSDHDIDFTAGNAQADDGSLVFRVSALTKRIDAIWVAGTNQGGLDTGTVANNIPYYFFAIYNPTTSISDILISASKTSPTLPSGFTKKCYLGACHTDGSANIRSGTWVFGLKGYKFEYSDRVTDYNSATPPTTRTAQEITTPVNVFAKCIVQMVDEDATGQGIIITSENETDVAPTRQNSTVFGDQDFTSRVITSFLTNSSSQIYIRSGDGALTSFSICTLGWEEIL